MKVVDVHKVRRNKSLKRDLNNGRGGEFWWRVGSDFFQGEG
jgi:hypothetical protein